MKRNLLIRSRARRNVTISSSRRNLVNNLTGEILKSLETLERRAGDLMRKFDEMRRMERNDVSVGVKMRWSEGEEGRYGNETGRRQVESQSLDVDDWLMRDENPQHGSRPVTSNQTDVSERCRKVPTFGDFFPALDEKYPVQTDRKLMVIVTAMRSGSSFLGTMLDQSDDTFYFFEPFWYIMHLYDGKSDLDGLKIKLLKSISTCRFDQGVAKSVIELISKSFKFARLYSRTLVDYPLCPDVCASDCPPIDVALLNRICLSKSVIVVKTVRISDMSILQHVHENAIRNDPEFTGSQPAQLHIVHLVRDPRGTMHSRLNIKGEVEKRYRLRNSHHKSRRLPTLNEIIMSDANALCNETMRHINMASQPPHWLLGRYFRLRFEDLATQPRRQMMKLMSLYGLPMTNHLVRWIMWNTNAAGGGGYEYGTRRKSVDVPHKWRVMLSKVHTKNFVKIIERSCLSVIKVMGYDLEFL